MSQDSLSVGIGEASLAFSKRQNTGLRRRSVIVMIALSIVTFGLYPAFWFLRRRTALNQLDSPRKLQAWPFIVFLAFVVLRIVVTTAAGAAPRGEVPPIVLLFDFGQLAVGILMIVQCFNTKTILEDHLSGSGDGLLRAGSDLSASLSSVFTFLFSIFYLQYVINSRLVAAKR